jgi:hypothetical protein
MRFERILSLSARIMDVRVAPGQMQLTRIPSLASSNVQTLLIITSAAFEEKLKPESKDEIKRGNYGKTKRAQAYR